MDYGERTTENMNRTDIKRYIKECYIHAEENTNEEKITKTMEYWSQSLTGQALKKYGHHLHGKVCDVGCGFGAIPLLTLQLFPTVTYIMGVDIFYKAINLAIKYSQHLKLDDKSNFHCANFIENLSPQIPNNYFDCIMSFHTLEHIYKNDHDQFINNIRKISKPQAKIIISIPYDHEYGSPEHVSFFNEETLPKLLEKHNCKTIEIDHWKAPYNFLTGIFEKLD